MTTKKLPIYLNMKGLQENIINWSDDTVRRRIKEDGFPAVQDDKGRWLFPTQEVIDWLKRRTYRAS